MLISLYRKTTYILLLITLCACSWNFKHDEIYAFDAIVYGNKKSINVNEVIINNDCKTPDCKAAQKDKKTIISWLKYTNLFEVINKDNSAADYTLNIKQNYSSTFTNKLGLYTLGILPSKKVINIKYTAEIINNQSKQKQTFSHEETGTYYVCLLTILFTMTDIFITDGNRSNQHLIAERRIIQHIVKDTINFVYPPSQGIKQ